MLVHPGLLTMKVSNTPPSDFNELFLITKMPAG